MNQDCYLIAFLTFDDDGSASCVLPSDYPSLVLVRGFGVFSEPEPTVDHRYVPAQLWVTHGKDYEEAEHTMRADIRHFANMPSQLGRFWRQVLEYLHKNREGPDF